MRADLDQTGPILLVLAAALLWAYTTILIRQIVHAEPTAVVMLVSNLTLLAVCAAAMPFLWQAPSAHQLGMMLLVGAFGGAGQFLQTEAIRRAPATVVAPLSFSSLVWSFGLGLAIWGDVPDFAVFLGAGRSGSFAARRAPSWRAPNDPNHSLWRARLPFSMRRISWRSSAVRSFS